MPSTVPAARGAEGLRPSQVATRAVREILVGQGLTEVINYAFVSDAAAGGHAPPRRRMANPLSEEQGVLRSSLVVPGLLGVRTNLRQGRRVRVLKWPVGGAGAGRRSRRAGSRSCSRALSLSPGQHLADDGLLMPGALELLARRRASALTFADGVPGYMSGQVGGRRSRGPASGLRGQPHPDVAEAWELRDEVVVAEVGLDALVGASARALPGAAAVATVERDVSVIGDVGVTAAAIEARIRAAAGPLLRAVSVVDRFLGPPVPGQGESDLRPHVQDPGRTLTGEEVRPRSSAWCGCCGTRGWKSGEVRRPMQEGFGSSEKVRKAADLVKRLRRAAAAGGGARPAEGRLRKPKRLDALEKGRRPSRGRPAREARRRRSPAGATSGRIRRRIERIVEVLEAAG
jgi:phenylalanyl-tRNA synthetase beta chain